MSRRFFVTGTDTGVGKTVVTACLAQAARRFGTVIAAKPVASGGGLPGEDALLIAQAAGHAPLQFAGYEAPLSPHRAAAIEGRSLDVPALERWIDGLSADTVLIEGVGGWRVPITSSGYEVADLARAARAPVLIVSRDRLGTLNHSRLTAEAIVRDGLPIAAIFLVRGGSSSDHDPSTDWNLQDLRALLHIPIIVVPDLDPNDPQQRMDVGLALWADLA
jgi:dethiobiotin synthetase